MGQKLRETANEIVSKRHSSTLIAVLGITRCIASEDSNGLTVTAPPDSFFQLLRDKDRDAGRAFYKKYVSVKGMPVVASGKSGG
jgi:hypothetical protein